MASFTFSGGRIVFIDMRCVYVVNSFATGKIENTNQIENAQFSHTFVLSIRRRFIYIYIDIALIRMNGWCLWLP